MYDLVICLGHPKGDVVWTARDVVLHFYGSRLLLLPILDVSRVYLVTYLSFSDIDHKYYSYTWPVPHLPTKKHEKKDKTKVVKVEDEELKTVSASLDKNLTISPYCE